MRSENGNIRFSVACNFSPDLVERMARYPVYELYGKLTSDYFGGGRPSFYLPQIGKKELAAYVKKAHAHHIEFNYLLNSSSMNNIEFTTNGQRKLVKLLDWLIENHVDSITVSNLFFLRYIKKNYPGFKVRISAHRETDNVRKVRFWEDNGADCVVLSETTVHREFRKLRAMREAVKIDLSLIVNNWCRQDCAIASSHAIAMSNASRKGRMNFPIDYCSVYCNAYRLEEPVNYIRANWIRPDDLHHYIDMGYTNFKIVERNTPTDLLEMRVRAYHKQRYDGNLLDIVQNYAYPASAFKAKKERELYSKHRLYKYFAKPFQVNIIRFFELIKKGRMMPLLLPRFGDNPVYIDNRMLDSFLERFTKTGCEDVDCEACRYCHQWAEKSVHIDRQWRAQMSENFDLLLGNLHAGYLWQPYMNTLKDKLAILLNRARPGRNTNQKKTRCPGGEALPNASSRSVCGEKTYPLVQPCDTPKPGTAVSVGNEGPSPEEAVPDEASNK